MIFLNTLCPTLKQLSQIKYYSKPHSQSWLLKQSVNQVFFTFFKWKSRRRKGNGMGMRRMIMMMMVMMIWINRAGLLSRWFIFPSLPLLTLSLSGDPSAFLQSFGCLRFDNDQSRVALVWGLRCSFWAMFLKVVKITYNVEDCKCQCFYSNSNLTSKYIWLFPERWTNSC